MTSVTFDACPPDRPDRRGPDVTSNPAYGDFLVVPDEEEEPTPR